MAQCEVCGNNYDKSFEVSCAHCHCRIVGHGIEAKGIFYCCAHCAKKAGVVGVDDRV
ncbi:MAG TPA: hypothetical protein VH701_18765 [Vicinamibacterales bacterium]|jgi:hypothetical protein